MAPGIVAAFKKNVRKKHSEMLSVVGTFVVEVMVYTGASLPGKQKVIQIFPIPETHVGSPNGVCGPQFTW